MEINNWFAVFGLFFLTTGILLELVLIPRQIREVRRPKDEFSRMRLYVLARPVVYVITFSPFVLRLTQVISQPPRSTLAGIVTVIVPFGLLLLATFTHLTYTYKEKP